MFAVTSMFDFIASAGILSGLAAFPYLICLKNVLISSIAGEGASTGNSVGTAPMSGGFSRADLFKGFTKCSSTLKSQ
ncbi:unnamed protein product [Schistosoma curassoni]|uniref:Secreted protein n=1 Tax=Schistosoma curassoni TaxID=6186 RepID=A0A183L7H7_9TREM|nr:unnamed protein product [Schistosoma curassoni]